ncbi:MAG: helix-turn-helix transcriptional regulator [Oscillospiraceae bacterium]|nr:helix-turn-helix transcriptional regulator [Oscillospiraceae bacterium]
MKNLRKLREEQKISQKKLADNLGLAQPQIHGYETGAYEPEIAMLKEFANFFQTSIDYIVGHIDIKQRIEHTEGFALNKTEAALIEKYRKLNNNAQNGIMNMIDTLLENAK